MGKEGPGVEFGWGLVRCFSILNEVRTGKMGGLSSSFEHSHKNHTIVAGTVQ